MKYSIRKITDTAYNSKPCLLLSLVVFLLPADAFAGEISDVICSLATSLTGLTGKAIASVALIGLGVGAMFNRVSLATAMAICLGIGILFGAGSIMGMMGLGNSGCTAGAAFPFSCNGPNAVGNIMAADSLANMQGSNQNGGIFGKTIFIFKDTIGGAMSAMYCSVEDSLRGAMTALVTVLIIVFGIGIAGGMINLNMKEAGILLFKIALVWAFAMDPAWGIGIGYRFFVSFAEEGAQIAMSPLQAAAGSPVSISTPDAVIAGMFTASTNGTSPLTATVNVPSECLKILLPLALLLVLFMPFVIIFILLIIIQYIGLFAKCLLGYFSALILISFLFIFAPLFLGFALFKTTNRLFEGWLSFLTSFSLQMVVMFGFLSLIAMIPVGQFFTSMLGLLKEYDKTFEVFMASFPVHFCGICDYTITGGNNISCNIRGHVTAATTALDLENFSKAAAAAGYMLSEPDVNNNLYWVISLLNLMQRTEFAQFVVGQVMAIFLIGRVLEDFLKKAPEFARALGGQSMAAALGGKGSETQGAAVNYIGMGAMTAGYYGLKNGLLSGSGSGVNPFRKEGGGYTLNPLQVGKNIGYNMTRAPISDWKNRLTAAVIGEQAEILDADGNVVGYHKRQGGLIGGILHGAYDESTVEGQMAKHKETIKRADLEKQQLEYNQANAKVTGSVNEMANAERELKEIIASQTGSATERIAREVVKLQSGIKLLENTLEEKNAEIASTQQEIVALENSRKPDTAALAVLLNKMDGLQREVSQLEAEKTAQDTSLQYANQKLDMLLAEQDEILKQSQELTRLTRQVEIKIRRTVEIEAQIAAIQQSGTVDETVMASLTAELATLKNETADLEVKRNAVRKSLTQSQKDAHNEAIGLAEKEKAADQRLDKAANEHNIALEEAEKEEKKFRKAQKSLDLEQARSIQRHGNTGLLETRSEVDGKILNRSDLEHKERDATSAELDRLRRNSLEMKQYKKLITATKSDSVFLLQMPEGMDGGEDPAKLESLRSKEGDNLKHLRSQFNALPPNISESDRRALMDRIASVENMVENADNALILSSASAEIASIGNDIAALSRSRSGKK